MKKTVLLSTLILFFILSTLIITWTSKGEDKEYNITPSAKGEFFNCLMDCCKVSGGEWMNADEFRQALRKATEEASRTGKPFHSYGFSMEDFESAKGCYFDCSEKGQVYEECKSACREEWIEEDGVTNPWSTTP